MIYFYRGGYTVGSVDEFETGLRFLANKTRSPSRPRSRGGDSAVGWNMTAVIALRRRDEGKKNIVAQILLYPEARLPFDTPAASENNSGYYLKSNGIFFFADHHLLRGTPDAHKYVSPGMQESEFLKDVPPAAVFTSGFDPVRDVGGENACKLEEVGEEVHRHHCPARTREVVRNVTMEIHQMVYKLYSRPYIGRIGR